MNIKAFRFGLFVALFSCLIWSTSALAAVMAPLQGASGTIVTVSEVTIGQDCLVRWDAADLVGGTVDSSGNIYFPVPETTGGVHTVEVQSPVGTSLLSGNFTVLPSITIDPAKGEVGATISVSGKGFAATEGSIAVTYGGNGVKTGIAADSKGSWSTTFAVPASAAGGHGIDASGGTTQAASVEDKAFTVTPKIALEPSSGVTGTVVTIGGSGFAAAEANIKVIFDGKEVKSGISADAAGSWSATFTVPTSPKGGRTVDASGAATNAADVVDVTFSISPTIGLDRDSVHVGETVNVMGNGFDRNEGNIVITLDGNPLKSGLGADSDGRWSASIAMPALVNGKHVMDAKGGVTTAVEVPDKAIAVLAQIVLNPKGGNVGDTISVTGNGFNGSKSVNLTYAGVPALTSLSTDPTGSFTANFKAPKGKNGSITVAGTDAVGATASAVFAMETTPPPVPQIVSPAGGSRVGFIGDTKVTFDWTDVSDPSGVYYDLQVSTQADFAITLVKRTDLAVSDYTLKDSEVLPHGDYYWRVRAIDNAGNSSQWTVPAPFQAALVSTTIAVVAGGILLLLIILLVVLMVSLGRNRYL